MSLIKAFSIFFILTAISFSRLACAYSFINDKMFFSFLEEVSDEEETSEEKNSTEELEYEYKDAFNDNFFQSQFLSRNFIVTIPKNFIFYHSHQFYHSPILSEIVPPPDFLI